MDNQDSVPKFRQIKHTISLKILNMQYNHVFQFLTCRTLHLLLALILYTYGVSTIHGKNLPYPEYLIMPVVTVWGGSIEFVIFLKMSQVRIIWDEYQAVSKQRSRSPVMNQVHASFRPIEVQLANFGIVDRLTPLTLWCIAVDYMITLILTTS